MEKNIWLGNCAKIFEECVFTKSKKYRILHSECDICFIKDIKEGKIKKLKDNLLYLEKIITFDSFINKLKEAYEEISDKKELLKIKIQKLFTKIRNDINKREDHLLRNVDQV